MDDEPRVAMTKKNDTELQPFGVHRCTTYYVPTARAVVRREKGSVSSIEP